MTFVTLIGKKMAREGTEFIYMGVAQQCRNCKLKMVCSNLRTGRRYRVTTVREKEHACELYEGGVVAVEIEKLPIETTIRKDSASGTSVTYAEVDCDRVGCENYGLCHPGVEEKKYRILDVVGEVDCPLGYALKRVRLDD
ncbi:MAG TPA: UPF0179 family protein [Thermoplasmatales archaeon]|nr:UPF0179 family protein [Candidatus Thermoplasmatota archaeon]HDS59253.1 UPF0179 family protein [Thermoplasmatales archaeon]